MAAAKTSQHARDGRMADVTGAGLSIRSAATDEAGAGFMVVIASKRAFSIKISWEIGCPDKSRTANPKVLGRCDG
jgi:hypothetical protein